MSEREAWLYLARVWETPIASGEEGLFLAYALVAERKVYGLCGSVRMLRAALRETNFEHGRRGGAGAVLSGSGDGIGKGIMKTNRVTSTELGRRLRTHMTRRSMSTAALSRACGCCQSAITKWLSGERVPSALNLAALACALHCATDELVGARKVKPDQRERKAARVLMNSAKRYLQIGAM